MISRRSFMALLGGAAAALGLSRGGALARPLGVTRIPFENNSMVQMFGDVLPGAGAMGDTFMCTWPGAEAVWRHDGSAWQLLLDLPKQHADLDQLLQLRKIMITEPTVVGHLSHGVEGDPIPLSGWAVQACPSDSWDDDWVDAHNEDWRRTMVAAAARADAAIAEEVRASRPTTERELEQCRTRALTRIGVYPGGSDARVP